MEGIQQKDTSGYPRRHGEDLFQGLLFVRLMKRYLMAFST